MEIPQSSYIKSDLQMMRWNINLPFTYFKGLLTVNHPPVEGTYKLGFGKGVEKPNDKLIKRMCEYIKKDIDKETYYNIAEHSDIIDYLKNDRTFAVEQYMWDMFSRKVMDHITQGEIYYDILQENKDDIQKNAGFSVYDKLFTLLESVGLIPTFSPEEYVQNSNYNRFYIIPVDKYIEKLSEHLQADISAPKYAGNLFGIETEKYGLYSDRDFMCLGVAIRIAEKYWNRKDISIIDIGGGAGHLTYYLHKLGFTNLTTLDVPSVNASAMYFLGSNLPDNNIKFLSPHDFTGKYDLVINVDGLTQMDMGKAREYMNRMYADGTKHFYSVNREVDSFTIGQICPLSRVSRNPFWYRRGYVEEDYIGGLK